MLVVAIHDVAPSTEPEVRWLLAELDRVGVRRRVLKVIPHEDAASALRGNRGLVALIGDEVRRGSEVVLHGWTHRQAGRPWGPIGDVVRARLFGGGRAEFLSVGDAEVERRVRDGISLLAEVDVHVRGFCAPGWLARPSLAPILRDAGLEYAVWLTGLEDLRVAVGPGPRSRGRRRRVAPTGYLGVGGAQETLAQVGGALSASLTRATGAPLRVILHPQGARGSPHARRAIRLAGALAESRPLVTYAELLDA